MHILGTTTVIRQDGLVLMTRRSDVGAWVLPGGHLDSGETIEQGCVREVREETGLDVEFERAIGLYSLPYGRALGGLMSSTFLCTCCVNGGQLRRRTDECLDARYFPPGALPRTTIPWHRRFVADVLAGPAETLCVALPANWISRLVGPVVRVRRLLNQIKGRPEPSVVCWTLGAFACIFDDAGRILLSRRRDYDVWNLPGGGVHARETPWEAAVREVREESGLSVTVERLTGIYQKPARQAFVFAFHCRVTGGWLQPTREAAEHRAFALDDLPEMLLPKHRERIADAAAGRVEAVLKVQDTPPGLEVLGLR